MITSFLLSVLFGFISFLVGLLPLGGSIPVTWTAGVYAIWGYVNAFSFIVPVNILVASLAVAMAFHLFVFAWKVIHWVVSMIRGSRVH